MQIVKSDRPNWHDTSITEEGKVVIDLNQKAKHDSTHRDKLLIYADNEQQVKDFYSELGNAVKATFPELKWLSLEDEEIKHIKECLEFVQSLSQSKIKKELDALTELQTILKKFNP